MTGGCFVIPRDMGNTKATLKIRKIAEDLHVSCISRQSINFDLLRTYVYVFFANSQGSLLHDTDIIFATCCGARQASYPNRRISSSILSNIACLRISNEAFIGAPSLMSLLTKRKGWTVLFRNLSEHF